MNRTEALELLQTHLKNKNLIKHCLSVEACLRALAVRLGHDPEPWGLAGLVHDMDYELTEANAFDPAVIHAVRAHAGKVPCESPMDWAIYSVDPLTGLIIAAALMHPEKKLARIDLDFIKRRYKEKSFARGARREEIEQCSHLGLTLDEFIATALAAMQGIAADLGL
jgi:predicted hydrolase (HD superfamily)